MRSVLQDHEGEMTPASWLRCKNGMTVEKMIAGQRVPRNLLDLRDVARSQLFECTRSGGADQDYSVDAGAQRR